MVCKLEKGKMAAMVRLLATGNYPEITAEEASHEKLAAQSIYRELREANEANLLEEEDMHVFDCKPMTDPLQLVCCKACKKPVKASQYAAHAERCRSLNSTEENGLELDGGMGHKKPPRKGKKKFQTVHDNYVTTAGEQERSDSIDADDTAVSGCNLDEQAGMTSSFFKDAKRNSASIDRASLIDGSGVNSGSANCSAGLLSPSEKRTKLIAGERLLLTDDIETACGVTKNKGREFSMGTIAEREKPFDYIGRQTPGQMLVSHLSTKDVPVPLATKIYRCQRDRRLRSALSHLYYQALTKERCSNPLSPNVSQENSILRLESSPKNLPLDQMEDLPEKKIDMYNSHAARKPDQLLAQSSELCLGNSGGYPSSMNFSNQFRGSTSTFSRAALSVDTTPMGMMRSKYLSTPYSFTSNSGTSLGTMQQSNGSVPVV